MRYSKETKINVVNAIVKGELWLEQAMVKYAVNDRRVIVNWLRKYQNEKINNNIVNGNQSNVNEQPGIK